jgi:hypothetical protein
MKITPQFIHSIHGATAKHPGRYALLFVKANIIAALLVGCLKRDRPGVIEGCGRGVPDDTEAVATFLAPGGAELIFVLCSAEYPCLDSNAEVPAIECPKIERHELEDLIQVLCMPKKN